MKVKLACLALLLVAACGAAHGSGNAYPSPPTSALAAWQSFPATQVPRPIIAYWDLRPTGGGFTTGNGKIAGFCNKFTLSAVLPVQMPGQAVATWASGASATYPGISASAAFFAMSHAPGQMQSQDCAAVEPLDVTGVRFGTAQITTDRGAATMSAWLFTVTGVMGELPYPALPTAAFWTGSMTGLSLGESATVSPDGRIVTFHFSGAPPTAGPCGADYTGAVAESSSAVAVAVLAIPHESSGGPVMCTAIAAFRSVTVELATPLGGRVVVNASGDAVEACPETVPPASGPGLGATARC
jgi:hypothetical protein